MRGNHIAAERYRARAELIRNTATDKAGPGVRQQVLQIAEEYDWLAEAVETGAWANPHRRASWLPLSVLSL